MTSPDLKVKDPFVIWLTGLSGSGKSTVAINLRNRLMINSIDSTILDGDVIRKGLNSDLGFSINDRKENMRRIAEVSKIIVDSGGIVIVSFISPFAGDRDKIRKLFLEGQFIEVYLKCSLVVCEARDPKGLYKRARTGEIDNYTGITSPYDVPLKPEITLPTSTEKVEESVNRVIDFLIDNRYINYSV